ncbi:MAG: sialidase family protein [Mycobacteriales bacterium]
MTPSRLLVLPALALLASPLLTLPSQAATSEPAPTFRQYHAPDAPKDARGRATGGDDAGEPTVGYNSKTGNVMFMANKNTFRVNGFDLSQNEKATWTDVTDPVEGAQTSDPFLWTDPTTNRTFVNQLELQGGSLQAFTDDDGKTYTQSTMGCSIGIAFDHQSVTTGKFTGKSAIYKQSLTGYPNAVYYCTNDLVDASCSVSLDGGLNFLVATPVYSSLDSNCRKIFGHIKTDPSSGRLFLPPDGCGKGQAIYFSDDNSQSWTRSDIPGATKGDSGHPSITVAKDGTVYFAYGSADEGMTGRTHVVVSTTGGKTWAHDTALGKDLGIVTSRFPLTVAGDGDRAAVAFLGAKAPGNPSDAPDPTDPTIKAYTGTWDLYVSYTTDRGLTWKTYDATPGDPVQVGPICTRGTTCLAGRNLLDFNDMDLDGSGRVLIGLADGRLKAGDTFATDLAKATIVRQQGGPSLFAAAKTAAPAKKTGANAPAAPTSPRPAGGTLPTTGLATALPGIGLLLLLAVAVGARRRVTR